MAKEKKEKKDKSSKKLKLGEPVTDANTRISKKEKKDKKKQLQSDVASALLEHLTEKAPVKSTDGTSDPTVASKAIADVVGKLPASDLIVPFAQPFAEEKAAKKVLKCVRKGLFILPIPSPFTAIGLINPWQVQKTSASSAV